MLASLEPFPELVIAVAVVLFVAGYFSFLAQRYKRCPPNKALVVSGKTGSSSGSMVMHGGAAFIWPLVQESAYLDLEPIPVEVEILGARTKLGEPVDLKLRLLVAIGTNREQLQMAATRLLSKSPDQIAELAQEVIIGRLRETLGALPKDEVLPDDSKFKAKVADDLAPTLAQLGLILVN